MPRLKDFEMLKFTNGFSTCCSLLHTYHVMYTIVHRGYVFHLMVSDEKGILFAVD